MLPVEFDGRQPERIGTGATHPCELRVHPEQRVPGACPASATELPMGADSHSARF